MKQKNEPICLRSYKLAKLRLEQCEADIPYDRHDLWKIYRIILKKNRETNYAFQKQFERIFGYRNQTHKQGR